MLYDKPPEKDMVVVTFQDAEEVEVVRTAFAEHAAHLMAVGNDGSVSDYQKQVVAEWEGEQRSYRGRNHRLLVERLQYLHEATREQVDLLLNEHDNPDRIADAARRYELGWRAFVLAEVIELHATISGPWDVLED